MYLHDSWAQFDWYKDNTFEVRIQSMLECGLATTTAAAAVILEEGAFDVGHLTDMQIWK